MKVYKKRMTSVPTEEKCNICNGRNRGYLHPHSNKLGAIVEYFVSTHRPKLHMCKECSEWMFKEISNKKRFWKEYKSWEEYQEKNKDRLEAGYKFWKKYYKDKKKARIEARRLK